MENYASSFILFDRKILVSNLVTLVISMDTMSRTIVIKKNVWKYYIKLPDFKTQCKFCEIKYYYVSPSNFKIHIARHHRKIWKYEKKKKLMESPWMYFKYFNKLSSQCIICDANVPSILESLENHLYLHSEEHRENYILRSWTWKYCTKSSDFEVECDICHKNLSLPIKEHLNSHIKKKNISTS